MVNYFIILMNILSSIVVSISACHDPHRIGARETWVQFPAGEHLFVFVRCYRSSALAYVFASRERAIRKNGQQYMHIPIAAATFSNSASDEIYRRKKAAFA